MNLQKLDQQYRQNGFVSGIEIIDSATAIKHRQAMEKAESKIGSVHYKSKIHTLLRSPCELATHNRGLDLVERLIGPNILLYNATYIVKEPHAPSHVSWHQDLTYWGFDSDDQVSMWLALSPATSESGCMRMIPGSHLSGRQHHVLTDDDDNVLYSGQIVPGVAESESSLCPLSPGQASFHHGWTMHASMPNLSDDRRIGLNVQYIATHVRQTKQPDDSALLVRGVDEHNNFEIDLAAEYDLAPEAVIRQEQLEKRYIEIAKSK